MIGFVERIERHRRILRLLRRENSLNVAELARALGMNRETLRRDLLVLYDQGLVTRDARRVFLNAGPDAEDALSRYGVLTREERRKRIAELVREKQSVRVTGLARFLRVTPATIRSDLKELERMGALNLLHGYATATSDTPGAFAWTTNHFPADVTVIAQRATTHIESGDTVFIDNSLYGQSMAVQISQPQDVRIITTSLRVAYTLSRRKYPCEIITLSGSLQPGGEALRPIPVQPFLDQIHIDKAFFGLSALSAAASFWLEDCIAPETVVAIRDATTQIFACITAERVGDDSAQDVALPLDLIVANLAEVIVDDRMDTDCVRAIVPESVPVAVCGPNYAYRLRRNPGKRIGLAMHRGHFDFRREVSESLENACNGHPTFTLDTRTNNGTYETIIDGVNHLLAEGVDLLIDYSSNYDVGELVARKAAAQAVPLIMIDLPVQNAYYFGANNVLAGQMAGEWAARYINKHWEGSIDLIVLLQKEISGSVCRQRLYGSLDTLREQTRFNKKDVRGVDCSRGIDFYAHKLERHLSRLAVAETALVISFGEDTTVDTHEIIRRYSHDRRIIMVGQNHGHHVDHMMREPNSPLLGCVSYAPERYGERIIELAAGILEGRKMETITYTEHEWIPNPYRSEFTDL